MTLIFVVGNSRSGTTMMSRILARHSQIFSFHELHFFGELWTPNEQHQAIAIEESELLMARLLCVQRDGYLTQGDPKAYLSEAQEVIKSISASELTPAIVFKSFLLYEAQKNNKIIPCDHTPGNVFFINEILDLYPEARIINMIRDPRDVLLSQKGKWKRRFLGATNIPLKEAIRAKANYHPLTISKLWNSAVDAGTKSSDREGVYSLKFETLLQEPEAKVREICTFLGLSFEPKLLEVPQVGSSTASDEPSKTGIDSSKAGNWLKGGLSKTEVFLCQQVTKEYREKYNYKSIDLTPNYFALLYSVVSLPLQLTVALLFNLKRMRRVVDTLKRRLA